MENNEVVEPPRTSLGRLIRCMNPLSLILTFVVHHLRGVIAFVAMVIGGYLVWSGFNTGIRTNDLEEELRKIGGGNLLRYYEQAKDANERNLWGIVFKAYEKRYGKGAWVQHFESENFGEDIAYRDIAELAVGISTVEEREKFIAAHASTYEACVQSGKIDLALRYGKSLVELRNRGGKAWRVASCNPFAICVYEAVKQNADLWNWYLDNAKWCDSFLMTIEPELQDGASQESAGLAEAVNKDLKELEEEGQDTPLRTDTVDSKEPQWSGDSLGQHVDIKWSPGDAIRVEWRWDPWSKSSVLAFYVSMNDWVGMLKILQPKLEMCDESKALWEPNFTTSPTITIVCDESPIPERI